MKANNALRNLMNLFGALALVLSMWTAMMTGMLIGKSVVIIMHLDGYATAEFTVDQLYFQKGSMRGNRTYDHYYAEGTVNGQKEIFKLGEYVQGTINTREELEAQVSVGQKLKVLYNPDVPRKTRLRVLYPEKNFTATWKRRQKQMIRTGYGPWAIALLLCIFFGLMGRQFKSVVGFCFGATVFVIFSWIPTLLNLYF